ncbi:hypothetical protein H310_07699 [Aphanomyces invadans]|uniref:Transmembrane protein n=1 Tax=Aphanomyces invadans TaxID=157072 RepID=A0A024U256_9STRA|nr:hypothetical protein H310_07699 [Aphanomyces invadans]ETW00329.1 hypothetical protein H310_07699 [Aphanomyces invadans]|eukprot:XP_008871354.1 hypothetical protein H310_07699 [Aphanomyces invadans]
MAKRLPQSCIDPMAASTRSPSFDGAGRLSAAEALRLSSSDDMNPPMKPNDATASSLLSVGADCFKVVVDTGVSEVAMLQHLYGTMDYYGHTVTVKIITGATLVVLYLYVSGTSVINLEAYDPVVVDHAIAAIALSGPVGYALLLNMYYSDVETPVGLTLLTLRISCCCIIGAALTVFLAECFTRRLVISLVLMGYGAWGIGYAWSVPLWRWYMYEVRRHGLVAFLPAGLQDTLLRMTLLEWLTDTTFADKMRDYFPFFLPLDNSEQQRVVHSLPTDTQTMMKKPGLVHLLPSTLQEVLLPSPEYFSDSTDVVTSMPPLPATPSLSRIGEDSRTASTSATQATASMVGFDFHRIEPSSGSATSSSSNVLTAILQDKISSTVVSLVHMPSPSVLNRTAAISSFLFALQLTQSSKARVHFVLLLRVVCLAVLGTVATTAVSLRVIQVLTAMPSSRKYLALVQELWMRRQNGQRRLTDGGAAKTTAALVTATKYGAAAMAAAWVLKNLRK